MDLARDKEAGLIYFSKNCYDKAMASLRDKFDSFSYTMPFGRTNEDLMAYYKYFPIKDGNILIVVGSGDQILQAIKDCPKEIHAFDMNPLAIYMSKLKVASIQALDHYEFKRSFDFFSNYSLNEYYKKIREYLDQESCVFWDYIYDNIKKGKLKIETNTLGTITSNKGSNSYEHKDNYYVTKDNLSKVQVYYYVSKLFELTSKIKDIKFDTIILSNIYNWLNKDERIEFCKFVQYELKKYLLENGIIDVYSSIAGTYSYDHPDEIKEFAETMKVADDYSILVYKNK